MKPQILIPDLNATQDIDILEEVLQQEVERLEQKIRDISKEEMPEAFSSGGRQAEWALLKKEKLEAANAEHDEATEDLASYREDPNPQAIITKNSIITVNAPIRPHSSASTEKIKSVCCSGKNDNTFCDPFKNPFPVIIPDPMAIFDCIIW